MIALPIFGLAAWPLLPVAPLPQVDFPTISISASLPGASPETVASAAAQPLERQFGQIAGVTQSTSTSTLGSTSITLQFDLNRDIDAAAQDVQAAITAAAANYRPTCHPTASQPCRFPDPGEGRAFRLAAAHRIGRGQYQYTLQDANLTELNDWAPKILAKLQTLPELADASSDLQNNAPQLAISINRDQSARFGILPEVIDATLNDAFGQRQVAQYYTQTDTYTVVLEVSPSMQGNLETLDSIYLKSPLNGQPVPLSTLVTTNNLQVGPLSVSHQGQFPAVTISFNLPKRVALGQSIEAIEKAVSDMGKPVSLIGTFQGNAQAFQTSLSNEPILIAAALVVIYVILGMLYESFIHPLTILSTLPSAGVGALLALMWGGFDLSVIGIIGIILLIGIVKKNGIMLVDFAIHREHDGHSPLAAIREACLLRFRPILMTTMAAMLGGVPMMLGAGAGSELRQPLGYSIVGGLALSQLLTLYTTPVVYLYLDRLQLWLSGKKVLRREHVVSPAK